MSDPWERQEHESARAYQAFRDYRDLGAARGLHALHENYVRMAKEGPQKPPTMKWYTIGEWSRRNAWVMRAAAWDADLDRKGRQAQIEAVQEMNRRQADLGREMQRLAGMALRVMRPVTTETITEDGQVIRILKTDLTPQAVTALAKVGVELERLATGEATERIDLVKRVEELADEMGFSNEDKVAAVDAATRLVVGR